MSNVKKLMMSAAAGGGPLNVENVFSTYLFNSSNSISPVTVTNGIDLDGEGGMVWVKSRNDTSGNGWPHITDTERGAGKRLITSLTNGSNDSAVYQVVNQFNADGFRYSDGNGTAYDYASWTFRKAPKFFDVVTFTGTGSAQTISHNLGSVPGMIIVKRTNSTAEWRVYHRSLGYTKYLALHNTDAATTDASNWQATPTSSVFSVGSDSEINASGSSYVAYLFAHNNNDGGFGINEDQDIIKCGSYTGNSNGEYDDNGFEVNLGFEPQWIMIKPSTWDNGNWQIYDTMRGIGARTVTNNRDNPQDAQLFANSANSESYFRGLRVTPTGFKMETDNYSVNGSVHSYIYVAIRRGPMAIPENGTDVFTTAHRSAGEPGWESGFPAHQPVDLAMYYNNINTTHSKYIGHRQSPAMLLIPTSAGGEQDAGAFVFDYNDGWNDNGSTTTNYPSHMWSRAPNFFDIVVYKGDASSSRTVSHNLEVAPEMMWVKKKGDTGNWQVYHSSQGATKYSPSFRTDPFYTSSGRWNNTTPTSSVFTISSDSDVNASNTMYVAFLFASLDGVSKIGSYSGTGSNINVDCGFSNGARWIMIKRADTEIQSTTHWYVFDTLRGIVTGNDPYVMWNNVTAQVTNTDYIDPLSSGFTVTSSANSGLNASGGTYIYYAIA
jgi:hypothetical protein